MIFTKSIDSAPDTLKLFFMLTADFDAGRYASLALVLTNNQII